jgi:rhamnosyltransferase
MFLASKSTLSSEWFIAFLNEISPANSKMDLIVRNEIGLSKAFEANGIKTSIMFKPTPSEMTRAREMWFSQAKTSGIFSWPFLRKFRDVRDINHTHFSAQAIAERFGFIKGELVRNNPHNLDLQFLNNLISSERRAQIDLMVRNSQSHYQTGPNNITTLAGKDSPIPGAKLVCFGMPHKKGVKIAVILHLFYIDIIDDVLRYLRNIVEPFDLYVTTPFEAEVPTILNTFATAAESISVFISENRGRDIGPFIHVYRTGVLDNYTAVLKIHSKKSKYSKNGELWRDEIYKSLLGNSLIVRRTLRLFDTESIGIVGPHPYYLTNQNYWGANQVKVARLLGVIGLLEPGEKPELGFFAGSMFWFNPKALIALKAAPEHELLFEAEAGKQDGTLAHALERAFGPITRRSGFKTTSIILNGDEINDNDSVNNIVPVL